GQKGPELGVGLRWQDQCGKVSALRLRRRVTEDPGGAGVDLHDAVLAIESNNGVEGRFQDRRLARLGAAQGLLSLLAPQEEADLSADTFQRLKQSILRLTGRVTEQLNRAQHLAAERDRNVHRGVRPLAARRHATIRIEASPDGKAVLLSG